MGAYELILSIDDLTLGKLMSTGLLRSTLKRDIEVYEHYVKECKSFGKMQARTNTAEQFLVSEETVSRIIQRMK